MRLNNQTREKIVKAFRQKACEKEQAKPPVPAVVNVNKSLFKEVLA